MLELCVRPLHASGNHHAVGLTGRDFYAPPLNFVFGLAIREIGAAIVSWRRLMDEDEEVFIARIAKEVIHEVGHLEGLNHCQNSICVMWFSNTLSETDRKKPESCAVCSPMRSKLFLHY